MSQYLWLIDAGHGGIFNGEYQTEGKRSPKWDDGSILYEGEFNRAIANRLMEKMNAYGLRYIPIHDYYADISLKRRVGWVNHYCNEYENCILVSIHANAGGGRGWEVYTSKGETDSDKIATVFARKYEEEYTDSHLRSDLTDGDVDKEENFYLLKNTNCPAILTENFFMDNELECRNRLLTPWGRDRIAHFHLEAMLEIEKNGF